MSISVCIFCFSSPLTPVSPCQSRSCPPFSCPAPSRCHAPMLSRLCWGLQVTGFLTKDQALSCELFNWGCRLPHSLVVPYDPEPMDLLNILVSNVFFLQTHFFQYSSLEINQSPSPQLKLLLSPLEKTQVSILPSLQISYTNWKKPKPSNKKIL